LGLGIGGADNGDPTYLTGIFRGRSCDILNASPTASTERLGKRHRTGSSVRRPSEREWLEFPIETAPSPYPADERKPKAAFMQRSGTRSNDGPRTLPWEHRLMTKKITLEQKWHQLSEAAKKEAEKLPHGKEREALLRKARQLETASQIDQWISSPALQPPT
jgi:hypothetical protein